MTYRIGNFSLIIFIILISFLVLILVSSGVLWRNDKLESLLLKKDNDVFYHNLFTLQDISTETNNTENKIVLLVGSSSSRENIISDNYVEDLLRSESGQNVSFFSICGSTQTFAENAKVLNYLNEALNRSITIVLPVEPLKFSFPVEKLLSDKRYFYLENSESSFNLIENYQDASEDNIYSKSSWVKTAHTTLAAVLSRINSKVDLQLKEKQILFNYDRHRYFFEMSAEKSISTEKIETVNEKIKSSNNDFYNYYNMNFDLFEDNISSINEKNEVVIVNLPTNPRYNQLLDEEVYEIYYSLLEKIRSDYHISYIDLSDKLSLFENDFFDYRHLMTPTEGQQIYTRAFSESLAGFIQ